MDLGPDGQPVWRLMMLPKADVEVIDTWHTTGLRGSGSLDYTVTDLFVSEEHSFSFGRALSRSGPLAAPEAFVRNMPGVPLGLARAALDHVREHAINRVNRQTGERWSDNYRVQIILTEAEMDFVAARHAVYDSLSAQWELHSRLLRRHDRADRHPSAALSPTHRGLIREEWTHGLRVPRRVLRDRSRRLPGSDCRDRPACGFPTGKRGMVLDLGSGTGTTLRSLAARGHKGVGVDLSTTFVDYAESRAGDNERYVLGSFTEFDVVCTLFATLNLVPPTELPGLLASAVTG